MSPLPCLSTCFLAIDCSRVFPALFLLGHCQDFWCDKRHRRGLDKFGVITSAVYLTLFTPDTQKLAGIAPKQPFFSSEGSITHIFGHVSLRHIFFCDAVLPFLLFFLLILEFWTDVSSFWAPVPEMLVFPPLVLPHTHVHSSLPVWKFSGLTFQSERSGLCRRGLVLVVQSRLARTQSQLRHVLQIWSRLTFPRHLNRKILLRSDSILALLLRLPHEMPFVPKPQSGGETPRLIFDIWKIFFLAFFSCYAPSCRLTREHTLTV